MATPLRTLTDTIKAEHKVSGYAVIGAIAMGAWVRSRKTGDMDLLIYVPHYIEKTANRLERKFRSKGWSTSLSHEESDTLPIRLYLRLDREDFNADLHFSGSKLTKDIVSQDTQQVLVAGIRIPVAYPEALVVLKLLRPLRQDLIDAERLLAESDVDLDRLSFLSKQAKVSKELRRLIKRTGL